MDERALFDQFHEALDNEPPAGAYERLRQAFTNHPEAATTPRAPRIRRSETGFRMGHPRAISLVAALLAVLIVVSLVYVRSHSTRPTVPVASPAPASSIPASVLDATRITAAAALITYPNLSGTVGGRTVTLVGAYADAFNTTLIFHIVPAPDRQFVLGLWDDTSGALLAPTMWLLSAPDGYAYYWSFRAPPVSANGLAHLRGSIWDHAAMGQVDASPARWAAGGWNFSFNLQVRLATSLPIQRSEITVGTWKVTVKAFDMTPSTVYFRAGVKGPPTPSPPTTDAASEVTDSIALTDGAGQRVPFFVAEPTTGRSAGLQDLWDLQIWWARPTQAGTYRLVITGGGSQYSTGFLIPAPPQA